MGRVESGKTETQSWEVREITSGLSRLGIIWEEEGHVFNITSSLPLGSSSEPGLSSVAREGNYRGVAIEPRKALAH